MKTKGGSLVLLLLVISLFHGFTGCCTQQQRVVVQNPNQSLKDKREEVEALSAELHILTVNLLKLQRNLSTNAPEQNGVQPVREPRKYSVEQQERDLNEMIQIWTEAKEKLVAERDRIERELKLPWYFEDLVPTR